MRHFNFLPPKTFALQMQECDLVKPRHQLRREFAEQLDFLGLTYTVYSFEMFALHAIEAQGYDRLISPPIWLLQPNGYPFLLLIEFSSDKDFIVAKMRFT